MAPSFIMRILLHITVKNPKKYTEINFFSLEKQFKSPPSPCCSKQEIMTQWAWIQLAR